MTPTLTASPPELREALYALSIAKDVPDAALLDDIVRRFPQFGSELTNFAIAIAIDALHGDAVVEATEAALDPNVLSPAVSRAMSRFQNRLHAVSEPAHLPAATGRSFSTDAINPFASLSREDFRGFARRLDVSSVFVAKLRDRQIEPDTLTPGFQKRVADDLHAPLDVVVAHFAAAQGGAVGPQFYKADGKPNNGGRQTFEEAVRSSGLSEAQQRALLAL
ncbi:hypothetical protein KBY30_17450 [Ruegeria pomeroyi]|nr:hypothetical protein [Ruegeria pomeroyi]